MERRFSLADGQGALTLREEGGRVVLRAELPDDRRGLYKGWLTGTDGRRYPLGTFLPEHGQLTLQRTLSLSELQRQGVWPPLGAETALSFSPDGCSGQRRRQTCRRAGSGRMTWPNGWETRCCGRRRPGLGKSSCAAAVEKRWPPFLLQWAVPFC